MDTLSVICVVVGILVIAGRGPLIFQPRATLRAYDRWITATNTRCRAFGVAIATLAIALLLHFGEGALVGFVRAVGCVVATVAGMMLITPNISRSFIHAVFDYLENSVGNTVLRAVGLLAVVVGAALIYIGVYIV